jgi:hypothetical protein
MASFNPDSIPPPVLGTLFTFPRGVPALFLIAKALGPLAEHSANSKLQSLQQNRDTLCKLYGSNLKKSIIPRNELSQFASASEILGCIENYWTGLMSLILSVESDPERVHFASQVIVEWPSPLTRAAIRVKVNPNATCEVN